ncbi:hypothetical protein ACVWW2_002274 [Bradyrhizobium sp. LM4.3]
MAPTGLMPNVSGSSTEIVASGPIPGRTPHHVTDGDADETPHEILRLESDAEAVPEIGKRAREHLEPPTVQRESNVQHVGKRRQPATVTTAARTAEPFRVAVLSPSAETKTHMKLAASCRNRREDDEHHGRDESLVRSNPSFRQFCASESSQRGSRSSQNPGPGNHTFSASSELGSPTCSARIGTATER